MNAPDSQAVGVAGLGSMGSGMAQSLLRAGLSTWGFDVDDTRVAAFRKLGGAQGSLSEIAGRLDALLIVVVTGAQMEDLLFGATGVASRMKKGALIIGSPTVPPDLARRVESRLGELGLLYLDAPISGGAVKAAEGALTMMVSGRPEAMAAARPFLAALATEVFELGDTAGPASAMKVINQLLAGVHIASAAEAITFALSQGIAPARTVEVISKCAGTSWMFENRGPHIVDGDYTPRSAVDIFIKDLGIVTETARAARFPVPMAATALQQFVAAGGSGFGREDDAAVAKVYARNAGLKLPGE